MPSDRPSPAPPPPAQTFSSSPPAEEPAASHRADRPLPPSSSSAYTLYDGSGSPILPSSKRSSASSSAAVAAAKAAAAAVDDDALTAAGATTPLARQRTVTDSSGKVYPTRPGRGVLVGEPLTNVATNEQITYIDFPDMDPEDPFNWSNLRKYSITVCAISITSLTAVNATGYSLAYESAHADLGVSRIEWTLGNALYLISISITPLFLAPLSELIGRNRIYLVTCLLNLMLAIPQALSPNMTGILASRWFQGMCSSVGNSMVGGTIADLFHAKERGRAMSLYALFVFLGQGIGPLYAGWTADALGWRWVMWIMVILFGAIFAAACLVLKETRGSYILSQRAMRLTKETGRLHAAPGDTERADLRTMITQSISRPLVYLTTEPIVGAISVWVGFVWGCLFLFVNMCSSVYAGAYGFSVGQSGTVLFSIAVAGLVGISIDTTLQAKLYGCARRRSPSGRAEPEARLYCATVGALVFPLGILMFAWTGQTSVPWPVSVVAFFLAYLGTFCIYSGVFNYIADAYEKYSSSAQAAQSLSRNLLAAVLPLAGPSMFSNMTPRYASTMLGCIGLVLGLCPLLLLLYGKRLRARSKVASALLLEALAFEAERVRKRVEGEASRAASRAASRNVSRRGSSSNLPQQEKDGRSAV